MKPIARIIILIITAALAGCASKEFVCGGYIDRKSEVKAK
jgi:type IV pilus biogenesis protein CpaD/CtpE